MKTYTCIDRETRVVIVFEAEGYRAARRQLSRINKIERELNRPTRFVWANEEERKRG